MKIKNITQKIIILVLVSLILPLFGCKKEKDPEEEWRKKTVSEVTVVQESIDERYEYDEFEIGFIKLNVTYTDGTSRVVSADESMFDSTALDKMSTTGNPRVTLYYQDPNPDNSSNYFDLTFIVHLIDSSLLDKDLNRLHEYDAVIKAIRNKEANKIDFILEECAGACSFQFEYTFDEAIMQLSNFRQNANISGIFEADIKDGKLTVTILTLTPITEETVLFTVDFSGNFRTSKLAINPNYNNAIYNFTEEKETIKLDKVLYHASVK